jgi:hypothetical protein
LAKGLRTAALLIPRLSEVPHVDPKRISIKTMKIVESIEARLARIEAALGVNDPIGQSPAPQQQPGPPAPAPQPPPADPAPRQKERSRG